jgi:hypothetical protein
MKRCNTFCKGIMCHFTFYNHNIPSSFHSFLNIGENKLTFISHVTVYMQSRRLCTSDHYTVMVTLELKSGQQP